MYRDIDRCRVCSNRVLVPILDLGVQSLTGVFPHTADEPVTAGPLELVKCSGDKACGLVQLRQSYDPEEMYGLNYGYRSGLNASMVAHLQDVVDGVQRRIDLGPGDIVLDIGSNDSTLLQRYPRKHLRLVGIDPTGRKFREYYPKTIELIPEFFSAQVFERTFKGRKARVISSIAMLYDLEEPLDFFAEVREVLDDDGIWVFEQSYMPSMLQMNAYDTVCHEHLEYYGLAQIRYMTERAGFKIVGVELNPVNGGSFCVSVAKTESRHTEDTGPIEALLREEDAAGLSKLAPYESFKERVFSHRDELTGLLRRIHGEGKRVLGYGASTKGNVILQFCGITKDLLPAIAEVNADKFGRITPGTLIPIVSEAQAKALRPDYLLVLPWHFRENVLEREASYLRSGGSLVFPLPRIEVVGG